LLKIGDVETDSETERPICSLIPKINSVTIVLNPFDDIVPRNLKKDKTIVGG
jgi:peptidyl-prolyl cis-trans isomerase SDCCAG10